MPAVVFAFVDDKLRVLVETRPDTDKVFPGMTVLPGGKIDRGEGVVDALLREVREELGVVPFEYEEMSFIPPIYHRVDDPAYLVHPFVVTKWEGQIPKSILDSGYPLAWLNPVDAICLPMCGKIAGKAVWIAQFHHRYGFCTRGTE